MKNIFKVSLSSVCVLIGLVSFGQVQVLTGLENGTYSKLAEEMNKYLPEQTVEKNGETVTKAFLDVRSTQGSGFNFDLIVDEKHPAKAAIVQLDLLLLKKTEDLLNNTSFTDDIVVLMPLVLEDIHLVTKKGSPINNLESLEGMTVGIGQSTEGTYSTAMYIQNMTKINWNNRNISSQDAMKALLLDKIDAFFMVAGAPVQMLAANPVNSPLQLKLAQVENINGWADYYTPLTLTSQSYMFLEANVDTYSVPSVVIVNKKKLSEEDMAMLKEWKANTIQNIDNLKAYGHKSWNTANPAKFNSNIWPVFE
jgi:TRAP transporter TAXI family solute receptor